MGGREGGRGVRGVGVGEVVEEVLGEKRDKKEDRYGERREKGGERMAERVIATT